MTAEHGECGDPTETPRPSGSGWLIALPLTTFVIGTDDFMIAGILPVVSSGLAVSEPTAGQLVTVFSLTYAVAAPVMAAATARLPRKRLLVGGLAAFALVNAATAAAPSYPAVMALRVLAALVAAAVGPAAFAVAGTLAPPERTGRAIGTVAAGMTVSLVLGVPLGSWVSGVLGWRWTFVAIGALTCIAIAAVAVALPRLPAAPDVGIATKVRLLRRPAVLSCVIGTVIGACAGLISYTYIAPVAEDLTGTAGAAVVPPLILVMGVSGALGTFIGGRLTDRWGVDRTLMASFGGVLLATVGLAAVGVVPGGHAPIWVVGALLVLWGVSAWGNNPPMTARVLRMAGDAGFEAVALNTSGLYLGIAIAGAVGGAALAAAGGAGVLLAGAAIGIVTIAVMTWAVMRFPAERRHW